MIRYSFKASLFALSLGICVSASAATVAEPEIHFYPAKSWTINSTSEDLAGVTVQKCTISNQFNNGFVIQLNGSHKWVQSMQIDFRQDAFNPGQSYDVALTVPGVNNKALSGKAGSKSQIVINMTGQKEFYQAMRDSAVMDLKIDNNEFRFYMLGFASNATGFERCMAGGDIQAAQAKTTTPNERTKMPTFNEAIAYEQAEKTGAPIPDIMPSQPRPTLSEQAAEIVADVEAIAAAPVADVEAVQATKAANLKSMKPEPDPTRKKLTEMLAEEIKRNPEIAAVDSDVEAEPKLIEKLEGKAAAADVFSPAPKELTPEEEKSAIVIDPAEPKAVVKPMEIKKDRTGLVMPPNFNERPALPKPLNLAKEEDAVEVVVSKKIEIETDNIEDKRALTDNIQKNKMTEMALAQLNAQPEDLSPAQVAPVMDAAAAEAPIVLEPSKVAAAEIKVAEVAEAPASLEAVTEVSVPVVEIRAPEIMGNADPEMPNDPLSEITPMTEAKMATAKTIETPKEASTPDTETLLAQSEKVAIPEPARMKMTKQTGSAQVDFSDQYLGLDKMEPASAPPMNRAQESELGRKLSTLQREMEALRAENAGLNEELKSALSESKQEQLSISSENWNLEKVTKRYDEAERQLKRLGLQLQQERAACAVEKKDLEAMLFDPSLTADAQTAKLVELRRELDAAQEKIRLLQAQP